MNVGGKASVATAVRTSTKAGIFSELPVNSNDTELGNDERDPGMVDELPGTSNDTDSDNDETDPGMMDTVMAQLFNWITEDEEFQVL
ncbi:unnamed protein product [Dibothriocephalus latus]|uniref:Uncharacterized protein n=1 Tax=Dibothriocephalus latus TaxID=60516 RepID=A0A3P7PCG7_DIBLA|nr:unnamed protein product [Dibothriocephalus latus]